MAHHERRLLDPPANLVADEMLQAVRAADLPKPLAAQGLRHWQGLIGRLWQMPAGRRVWSDDGRGHFISLAWWTDAVGRRHIRIVGENKLRGEESPPLPANEDPRPPLAHVFPDRLFRRQRDGVDVWLAVCACGATGKPEALAWMGPCCGPCHDRREEQAGMPRASAETPTLFISPTGAHTILFSPDGRTLAAADGHHLVRGWDIGTGESRVLLEGDARSKLQGLAWSPEGTQLAVGDMGNSKVFIVDLARCHREVLDAADVMGDPDRFAFLTEDLFVAGGLFGCVFWQSQQWYWRERDHDVLLGPVTALAVASDGALLAVGCDGGIALRSAPDWKIRIVISRDAEGNQEFDFLSFCKGHTLLAVTCPTLEARTSRNVPWQRNVTLVNGAWEEVGNKSGGLFPLASCLDLTPDERYLAGVVHLEEDTPARVAFWEVPTGREVAALECDPTAVITDVAFSPDNETLATAQRGGIIKLWPWRRLLDD